MIDRQDRHSSTPMFTKYTIQYSIYFFIPIFSFYFFYVTLSRQQSTTLYFIISTLSILSILYSVIGLSINSFTTDLILAAIIRFERSSFLLFSLFTLTNSQSVLHSCTFSTHSFHLVYSRL